MALDTLVCNKQFELLDQSGRALFNKDIKMNPCLYLAINSNKSCVIFYIPYQVEIFE